jgi:hypothetical protein
MTIEQTLERIATSCERNERLTEQLIDALANAITRQAAAPVAVSAPVAAAPVVATPAPVAAPVTPAAPVVEAPVQAAPTCPITDQASLVAYVMTSYKEMGPVKGNQIQGVLAALGITNINEATAAHYPAIYSGVEALKAQ